jgi:AcrR family transcriptional regulator
MSTLLTSKINSDTIGAEERGMEEPSTIGKRASYHHGDLRRALIDAALGLIADAGASSFTLRAVARRAGVSHAAPYRHFADKTALLAAVAEEGFRALGQRLLAMSKRLAAEPLASFQTIGVEYVRFAVEHPAHFRVMFGPDVMDPTAYPTLHAVSQGTLTYLVEAVTAGQRAHTVRPGEARTLALVAWAQVHGLATLLVDHCIPVSDPEQVTTLAEQAVRVLYEGLHGNSAEGAQ